MSGPARRAGRREATAPGFGRAPRRPERRSARAAPPPHRHRRAISPLFGQILGWALARAASRIARALAASRLARQRARAGVADAQAGRDALARASLAGD